MPSSDSGRETEISRIEAAYQRRDASPALSDRCSIFNQSLWAVKE